MEIDAPLCDTCGHNHYEGVRCQICGHHGKCKIHQRMKARAAQSRSYKVEFYDGASLPEQFGNSELLFELRRMVNCNELGIPENQEFDVQQEISSRHVIAWVGDLPIGFGRFQILNNAEQEHFISIDRLGVISNYRTKGFAGNMLEQIFINIRETMPTLKVITIKVPTAESWMTEKMTSKGWQLANAPLELRGNINYAIYAIQI